MKAKVHWGGIVESPFYEKQDDAFFALQEQLVQMQDAAKLLGQFVNVKDGPYFMETPEGWSRRAEVEIKSHSEAGDTVALSPMWLSPGFHDKRTEE